MVIDWAMSVMSSPAPIEPPNCSGFRASDRIRGRCTCLLRRHRCVALARTLGREDLSMPDVILPALNEAAAVEWVLGRMPPGFRAIVVDNGSTDATAAIAAAHGATVVSEPTRGFGSACAAGLAAATADVVCFMDCDASLDPVALPLVAGYVERAEFDLVLGSPRRPARRLARSRPHRQQGTRRQRASTHGPRRRATWARCVPRGESDSSTLGIEDRRSGWPLEMVLRAASNGWKVKGVPVEYSERAGRSKVTGTLRGNDSSSGRHEPIVA